MMERLFMMSEAYEHALKDQNASPPLRARVKRIRRTWGDSIIGCCLIYMFFLGLIFATNPLFHAIPRSIGWGLWGNATLVFFGVLFVILAAYGALYPERGAGAVATIVLSGLGIVTSTTLQFSPIGILFWTLAIIGALYETVKRVRAGRGKGQR